MSSTKKQETQYIHIRAPKSIHEDLVKLSNLSGLTMNGVCIEILRKGIKEKLKEFELK